MATDAYTSPDISSLLGVIDTHLRWKQIQTQGDRTYHSYHPSELGKCLRHQQYKHLAEKGYIQVEPAAISSKLQRLFDKGHNMHHRWQQWYFADMGILRGVWECPSCHKKYGEQELQGCFEPDKCECGFEGKMKYHEVVVRNEEMNIAGHADIILDFSRFDPNKYKDVRTSFNVDVLPTKPIVIDMKTIGSWQWKNKVQKYGLHKEYMIQIVIYAHLLDCAYGIVIYENKDNSEISAHKVDRNDILFNKLKEQLLLMQRLAQYQVDGKPSPKLPPPKPESKDNYECKNCEFASLCHKSPVWDDPNLEDKRKKFYGITL